MKRLLMAFALLFAFCSLSGETALANEASDPKAEAAKKKAEEERRAKPATVGDVEDGITALRGGEDAAEDDSLLTLRTESDWLWTCIAAFLVFFMQAGFAMVEAGFTRAKNAVNILMKNLMDFSIGSLAFWAIGFGLMFGLTNGLFGTNYFFVSGLEGDGKSTSQIATFWIFQTVFAATAATIVSGGMAERTKFIGYLCYTVIITCLIYPIFGSWAWGSLWDGEGWLETMVKDKPFIDFAGSTVVHSVGGWAALAGALVLGARRGKFGPDGKPRSIPGHSMPMAALGVFILWLGWFGFNPGSTTEVGGGAFARIAVTTNLAAAAGAIAAMTTSWVASRTKKPQIDMSLNGALAGLVAITAPCATVTFAGAIAIGLIAGVLVYYSVLFFERMRVDDPVGAVSVHAVCGAWGTLACGLFGAEKLLGIGDANTGLFFGDDGTQLGIQFVGVAVCFIWVMGTCLALFTALKAAGILRAEPTDELRGLDFSEHGSEAYPGFVLAIEMDSPANGGSPEPRHAMSPPPDSKRYEVLIEGLSADSLIGVWSKLCQPQEGEIAAEFKEVYPFLTTVQGSTFRFRGGDPQSVCQNLESLLQGHANGSSVKAHLAT